MAKISVTGRARKRDFYNPQGGEYEKEPGPDSDKIATPQRLPH
jgi:hypothetical protein